VHHDGRFPRSEYPSRNLGSIVNLKVLSKTIAARIGREHTRVP
jgi:hypothetical protein